MTANDGMRNDVETLMQLAGQLIGEGRFHQSAAVARSVTELAPNDPAGWLMRQQRPTLTTRPYALGLIALWSWAAGVG